MLIGIYSKLGAGGGSEFRAAEMASSIVKHSGHQCILMCERTLNQKVQERLDPNVQVALHTLGEEGTNKELFYKVDSLLIINSDSYSFSTLDYWEGRTKHHKYFIDISKIKQMVFLYNFVIRPAKNLINLTEKCKDVRMICANASFSDQVSTHKRFEDIRHLPRITLDSPIDPKSITHKKTPRDKIRIGKHSKSFGYKFNEEHLRLITLINNEYGDKIEWDFMGVPSDRSKEIGNIPNVTIRREHSISVHDYLMGIDIFLFFIRWSRHEPWSRAVAEGLMSGCPVIATDKAGNRDQVYHGNNGFLCHDFKAIYTSLEYLIKNPHMIRKLGMNGHIYSKQFSSINVLSKYLDFISASNR